MLGSRQGHDDELCLVLSSERAVGWQRELFCKAHTERRNVFANLKHSSYVLKIH